MSGTAARQEAPADFGREALRQQMLLEALFDAKSGAAPDRALGVRQCAARWHVGLAAYRGNALAHAREALRAQFPTVRAMLGDAAFDAVAARYWHAQPPQQGDLARVGARFAGLLGTLDDLRPWPWLPDCARLDWTLWDVMYDAPAALKEADLRRLAGADPARLRLVQAPGTRRVASPWPVVTLWRLHRQPEPDAPRLREALRQPGETAWVWREGLHGECVTLDAVAMRWLQVLEQAPSLAEALDAAPGDFDVAAWLRDAVSHGWLQGVLDVDHDRTPPPRR